MATAKITITLQEDQIADIRKRVSASKTGNVSGFIQDAVQRALQNSAEFSAMIDQALLDTGGPLTQQEKAWAKKVLSPSQSKSSRRRSGKAA